MDSPATRARDDDSVTVLLTDRRPIRTPEDVVSVRQRIRQRAIELGFNIVDQTRIVTAASELARNTVQYGGGGMVTIEGLDRAGHRGLRLTFEDQGPGIPDIPLAMKDGFTTGSGLGLGLSGARRLSSEFSIESTVGQGTTVVITRWR